MTKKNLLLLSVFALANCTPKGFAPLAVPAGTKPSIIGGEKATASDAVTASTVSLMMGYKGKLYSFCTGTLISEDLILTAAHCLHSVSDNQVFVAFGEVLPTELSDPNLQEVVDWTTHPEYRVVRDATGAMISARNDVALVKLAQAAPEQAIVVPILEESVALVPGESLLLAGYGLEKEIGERIPAKGLNFVRVPLAKLWESILVTDQNNAKGACNGDSGGPAYLETKKGLVVVGITRGPHDKAKDCRHYGEYTNATMFKTYILEEAAFLNAKAPTFTTERQ